jgi:prophage antirepressor-like protein
MTEPTDTGTEPTDTGTELETFIYTDKEIRAARDDDGEPWWVLGDICAVLGLKNVTDTAKRLADTEKRRSLFTTTGGEQTVVMINELGLYELVLTSRAPAAQEFKHWVKQTLREIRTRGHYLTPTQRRRAALMSLTIDRALDDVRGALAAHKYGSVEMHLDNVHRANVYALRRYAGAEALKAASKELTANPYILDQE